MPDYRRLRVPGGTYFFTLTTYQRQKLFYASDVQKLWLESVDTIKNDHPFKEIAFCILPDHIHLIWELPENDANYSNRISMIKRRFTIEYKQTFKILINNNASRIKHRESTIWQRRFWEHTIRDENDLNKHIDYVHFNPVKHGLVDRVIDWQGSSFYQYVLSGHYDEYWGGTRELKHNIGQFGE